MLLKLLIGVLLLYCAVAAALFFAQTSIFFPTRLVPPQGRFRRARSGSSSPRPTGFGSKAC